MTKIATIDWFGRWGTSVFSENTAVFVYEINENLIASFIKLHIKCNMANCQEIATLDE